MVRGNERIEKHTHWVLEVEHVRHVGHEGVHPVPTHALEATLAHVHHVAVWLLR